MFVSLLLLGQWQLSFLLLPGLVAFVVAAGVSLSIKATAIVELSFGQEAAGTM